MQTAINRFPMLVLVFFLIPFYLHANPRWYDDAQVEQGKQVFTENCMSCHGDRAQGTRDWKKTDKDGKYPPPPLNGNAHAWHHSIDILRRNIREGGIRLGGTMPSFKDKLNEQQIDAAIAFFQSQWNDEIYKAWLTRNPPPGEKTLKPVTIVSEKTSPIMTYIKQTIEGIPFGPPEETPVSAIYQVKLGDGYGYLSEDGRYLFTGDLIDLKTKKNLTKEGEVNNILTLLEEFPEKYMIPYPAEGKEKARLTVLTDPTCPFCKKLHQEVPILQKAGVTVQYIGFPRAGLAGEGYGMMKAVWCAQDKQKAMSIAKGTVEGKLGKKECADSKAVDAGYEFGKRIGITGTPALILPNGQRIHGYIPVKQLLIRLELAP